MILWMISLQSETSTGKTFSVLVLKHMIPSSASGAATTLGRVRLTVDGKMRRGSDREDDEGRAKGVTECEKSNIDVSAISIARIIV